MNYTLAFIALYIVLVYRNRKWLTSAFERSIPGPWRFPVVGSVHVLGRLWLLADKPLTALRQLYGDVCRLAIGGVDVVVLSGWRTVQQALTGRTACVFAGRPDLYSFRLASAGKSMSFNSYSVDWRLHRRVAERAMRRVCDASSFVEDTLKVEARLLVDELRQKSECRSPVDPTELICNSVAHTIYSFCYGRSRQGNVSSSKLDVRFDAMVGYAQRLIACHNTGNAVNFFPRLRHFLGGRLRSLERLCADMLALTLDKYRQHVTDYQPGRVRDALDALIESSHTGAGARLEEDRVAMTVQEYIGAGLDILQAAVRWMVLYISAYADVQDRVQQEVDAVVGRGRDVTPSHAIQMPYTESVILEVLRHSSLVPLALPHSTLTEATISGRYRVPADTFILVNLYSVNHDPDLWPDPGRFDPDRFTNCPGLRAAQAEGYSAFGFGRRRCLGEQLSRHVLFVYLATLLQEHRLELCTQGNDDVVNSPMFGIVLRPKPYQIVVVRRPE